MKRGCHFFVGGQEETSSQRSWGGSGRGAHWEKVHPETKGKGDLGSGQKPKMPQRGSSGFQLYYMLLWKKDK